MPQVVLKKTEEAIADSDIVLFMVDARQGVTEADRHYARYTRISSTSQSDIVIIIIIIGRFSETLEASVVLE